MNLIKLIFLLCTFLAFSNQSFAQKTNAKIEAIPSKPNVMNGFADIVEELLPAVVNISTTQEAQNTNNSVDQSLLGDLPRSPILEDFRSQLENQFRGQQNTRKKVASIGSGFLISKDGFVVTIFHVIEDASQNHWR
jgi:serine protease Do